MRLRSGGDGLRPTSGSLTQNGIPSLLPEPFPQAVDPSRTTSSLAEACASGNLERVRAELQVFFFFFFFFARSIILICLFATAPYFSLPVRPAFGVPSRRRG